MTTRQRWLFVLTCSLVFSGLSSLKKEWHTDDFDVRLSEKRLEHILYGDTSGGGHLHGQSKPCKSEFPSDWTSDKIVSVIKQIAANDNAAPKRQSNGYYTIENTVDDVRVRVVLDREKDDVITAYPINTKRNACPPKNTPANDNYNH